MPVKDLNGAIIGAFEIVMDQTEVKKAARLAQKVADYQSGEVTKLADGLNRIAQGDLNVTIQVAAGDADLAGIRESFETIGNALNNTMYAVKALADDANMLSKAAVEGKLATRADANKHQGDFRKIIVGVNTTLDSLVGFIDSMPIPALVIDNSFGIQYINKTGADILGRSQTQLVGEKCYNQFKTSDCNTDKCACGRAMRQGLVSASETDAHPAGLSLDIRYIGVPVKDLNGTIIGAFEIVVDQTEVKKAARLAQKVADYQSDETQKLVVGLSRLAKGDTGFTIEVTQGDADTEHVQKTFKLLADASNTCVNAMNIVTTAAEEIAGGNLLVKVNERSSEDKLMQAFATMVEKLREIVLDVKTASDNVASGSQQMSSSSEEMSQGASEQASSVEEVSSSMEEMVSNVRQNADNAQQTEKIALKSAGDARESGRAVAETVTAMKDIAGKDIDHRRNCQTDEPPCLKRGDRGGPGGRTRQGLCGRGL